MKNFFLTFFMTLFVLMGAYAQWTEETDVNTACTTEDALGLEAIGTSDGMTYIVFWRNQPAPVNIDLRVQLLDADGFPQFGDDGMLITDELPMSTHTVLWSVTVDEDDHLYVGVTGTGGGDPARVYKVDLEGNLLYGSEGIDVGSGNDVKLLPMSSGELLVSWYASDTFKAKVQRYDSEGTALWDEPLQVLLGSSSTSAADLFEMSDGDFTVVFHEHIGFGINSELYAQRYAIDQTAQWEAPVQLSNMGTVWNRTYSHVQIGDDIYYGYHASSAVRFDSYLQKLSPDGSLPWGINGVDFDPAQTDYEMTTHIAHKEDTHYIWAVCSFTDPGQGPGGDRIQKFDIETGERLLTDSGVEVFEIGSGKVHQGDLQVTDEGQPVFVYASELSVAGMVKTLSAVELDIEGQVVGAPQIVADYDATKSRINFTKIIDHQGVAVFIENKEGSEKIYAQNVSIAETGPCQPQRAIHDGPGGLNPFKVDAITQIQLGTLNDSEQLTDSFVDNTETATDLTPGESYTLTLSGNGSGNHFGAAWIDYNHNDEFEETELLGVQSANAPGTVMIDFTVPESVAEGTYRLRVVWQFSNSTPEFPDPCTEEDWGQTKDYTVNLIEQAVEECPTPEGILVDGVTADSAEITWESGGELEGMQFEVIYGENGFDPDSEGISVTTDESLATLENLEADTTYDVYVRALCDDGQTSDWSGPESFTTESLQEECPAPTDLNVSAESVEDTAVTVTWTAGGAEAMWVVIYGEEGFTEADDFETDFAFETTHVIENLDPQIYYDVYVVAVCDAAEMVVSEQTGPFNFKIEELSVGGVAFTNFKFYPNPVENQLVLAATIPIEKIEVFNLSGQQTFVDQPRISQVEINTESWSSGIYLMKITIDGKEKFFKVIKK